MQNTEHYIVRVLTDGLADDKHIESDYPHLAERLFTSTVELFQRMDLDTEVSVQLITPEGEIEYERTI